MTVVEVDIVKMFRQLAFSALLGLSAATAGAGLFDDEEARKAILDLRQRVEAVRLEAGQNASRASEDNNSLRRSLLELQNQIETLRAETAKLRGLNEQLARDLADVQRRQKDIAQGVDDRLRQFEPVKINLDSREFMADPVEKRDFDGACLLYTSPSPRDGLLSRMPSSA